MCWVELSWFHHCWLLTTVTTRRWSSVDRRTGECITLCNVECASPSPHYPKALCNALRWWPVESRSCQCVWPLQSAHDRSALARLRPPSSLDATPKPAIRPSRPKPREGQTMAVPPGYRDGTKEGIRDGKGGDSSPFSPGKRVGNGPPAALKSRTRHCRPAPQRTAGGYEPSRRSPPPGGR